MLHRLVDYWANPSSLYRSESLPVFAPLDVLPLSSMADEVRLASSWLAGQTQVVEPSP